MRVRFGGLELDEDRRELRRDGEPLAVEPRVFDLVAYLVRHRGRLVSKDELLDRLWPDSDVQEGALSVCVHRARRLLEEAGSPAIQTVARRGFRFVAQVELLREVIGGPRDRDLLVGRSAELAELQRAVEEVLPSRLRTVEVIGEPGIGKTALLEELGAYGRRHKLEVLRAAALPPPAREPFSLWAQLVAAYVTRYDARSVRRAMGEHIHSLARIVPSLRRWASTDAETSEDEARAALIEAIVVSIHAGTASRPVILLFDDFEHADADSLATMRGVLQACREVPMLIGVAYCEQSEAMDDTLCEMRAQIGHRRIALRGLDADAVRAMLEHLGGLDLSDATVTAAMNASDGKPALVEQWWRSHRAGGTSQVTPLRTRSTTAARTHS